ncbi:uncharacterized protein LOC144648763 [Oculina patagonica]
MSYKILKGALLVIGIVLYAVLWTKLLACSKYNQVLQLTNPPTLDAEIYDKVKVLLLFIGYNRSRHTLIASLLDAHPNMIIANDFNILNEWITNPLLSQRQKYYIYELLLAKSRYDVMYGVRSRLVNGKPAQYHYNIKGQWQGQYNDSIQVIGDKKAAQASVILLERKGRESLKQLEGKLGVQIKFIHVIRNPFDNIATLALRRAKVKKNSAQDNLQCKCTTELEASIAEYSQQVQGSSQVKRNFPGRVLDVYSMDVMTNTQETLRKICDFLEITCTQEYLDDCASIVDPVPSKTRHFVEWTKDQRTRVNMLIKQFSFLASFSFEN